MSAVPAARADLLLVDSLGWVVADSDVVVRGHITQTEEAPGPQAGSAAWVLATLEITETYKGTASGNIAFSVRVNPVEYQSMVNAPDLLVFLVQQTRYDEAGAFPAQAALTARRGQAWGAPAVLSLDTNAVRHASELLVTRDLTVVGTPEELLAHVIEAAQRSPGRPLGRVVFIPESADMMLGGRPFEIALHADSALAQTARGWLEAEDPFRRVDAIQVLAFFQTSDHKQLLRDMLDDPGFWTTTDGSGVTKRVYPVRKQAWRVLTTRWEVPGLTPPVFEEVIPPPPEGGQAGER